MHVYADLAMEIILCKWVKGRDMSKPGWQRALETRLYGMSSMKLTHDAQALSESYRMRTGRGERLVTQAEEALAYAASRMPATTAAVRSALSSALAASGLSPRTMLDCGAGTGAASWAADELLPLERVVCLEREEQMRRIGAMLMREGSAVLANAAWCAFDLLEDKALPRADLIVEGYVLGEWAERDRIAAAKRMWDATEQMLLLVEPGTPVGFENLKAVRKALCADGAFVAAPCPKGTAGHCPMVGGDWCHFTVRVQRTRTQKMLKGGEAPFEDEKFAYLALTREAPKQACCARVLRHPQIAPRQITLTLCEAGEKRECVVRKKDALWKRARKIGAGDAL